MPARKNAPQTDKTPAQQNASVGKLFELNDSELDTLKSTRGRKPEPSVYLAQVANAQENPGVAFGVSLTETLRAPWVMAQLRKAAAQLEIDSKNLTVYNREENKSDDHPHGFVAYRIKSESK